MSSKVRGHIIIMLMAQKFLKKLLLKTIKSMLFTLVITVALIILISDYNSLEKLKSFIRESAVMKNFHHPNVLQVLGISLETEDGLPYIVLPFMANGDLRKFLKNKRPEALAVDRFPEVFTMHIIICSNILCTLQYCWVNTCSYHEIIITKQKFVDGLHACHFIPLTL